MSSNGNPQQTPANGAQPEEDAAQGALGLLKVVSERLLEQTETEKRLVVALTDTARRLRSLFVLGLALLIVLATLLMGQCAVDLMAPRLRAQPAPLILSRALADAGVALD